MANILGSYLAESNGDIVQATWVLTQSDTGLGVSVTMFPDKTVQATGTFGTGGAIAMEGSNNGVDWSALHDYQGNVISLTDTSVKLIAENPQQIRPRATAGSGTTVTITLIAVK